MDKVVLLPFIIAGYLLSAGRDKSEQWWDYLDRAEAALEGPVEGRVARLRRPFGPSG